MHSAPAATGAEAISRLAFDQAPLACLAVPVVVTVLTGPDWSEQAGPLPWLVSLVLVGLPHGAADLAVSRTAWRGWRLVGVWCGYLAAMIVVTAGFTAAPTVTLALFACLSAWHFGHAETTTALWPQQPPGPAALASGCAVLAAPLCAWPAETADVARRLLVLTAAGHAVSPEQVRVLGCLLGLLAVLAIGWTLLFGCRDRLPRTLGHVGLLAALGGLTHPLFSVGLSFLVWHAWRQMKPLAVEMTGAEPESWRSLGAAVLRIHAAALPLLLPAWAALGTAWWAWSPTHSLGDLAILSIGGYLVVTPAHELLGDLRPGASSLRRRGYCTTDLLPLVEPPIGAPAGSGRPAVGMSSRWSSSRTCR